MECLSVRFQSGHVLLLDRSDESLLRGGGWRVDEQGYVARGHGCETVRLHHLILPAARGRVIDHRNGNRLDCRRENLRAATKAENGQNRGKPRTTAKIASQYKGVSWDKCAKRWRAKIVVDGRQRHLGYFDDEVAAARAYDAAARAHFGAFARLNFPTPELPETGPD